MSTYGEINVQSASLMARLEMNTGAMEDPDDEGRELEQWRAAYRPVIAELPQSLSEKLKRFADEDRSLPLAGYNADWPQVHTEARSPGQAARFLGAGNRPCLYRMRFTAGFEDTLSISVAFSRLPCENARKRLEEFLGAAIDGFAQNMHDALIF